MGVVAQPGRLRAVACAITLGLLMWVAVYRIGLRAADVALLYAVGGYAFAERRWGREKATLLGEEERKALRWWDFVCEQHQLLGCLVKGRRSRSERILALAVTTLALLYWRAFFRTRVKMNSLQGLRSSLSTLLVSKAIQAAMKRGAPREPVPVRSSKPPRARPTSPRSGPAELSLPPRCTHLPARSSPLRDPLHAQRSSSTRSARRARARAGSRRLRCTGRSHSIVRSPSSAGPSPLPAPRPGRPLASASRRLCVRPLGRPSPPTPAADHAA